jgi:hypothetical protein
MSEHSYTVAKHGAAVIGPLARITILETITSQKGRVATGVVLGDED